MLLWWTYNAHDCRNRSEAREKRGKRESKVIPVFLVENLFNLRPNIRAVRLETTEEEESDHVIIGRTDDKMKIINMLDNTNVDVVSSIAIVGLGV